MSFVWMCKCGQVESDAKYLRLTGGIRELTRCPGCKGNCEYFLFDYKRIQGKDDYGRN